MDKASVSNQEQTHWRNTLAGETVFVHEQLDGRVFVPEGLDLIAQQSSGELPPQAPKTPRTKATNRKKTA